MKKVCICIFIILFIIGLGYMVVVNTILNKNEEIIGEYIPEVEISDEELRKTAVTLYFLNSKDNTIQSEIRLIDSKELLRDPYVTLVGMLIQGPKDSNLKTSIPNETRIIDAKLTKNCVTLNFSKEFVQNATGDVNEKCNMIYTIINTLTELKEVESVKFLIEGEVTQGFEEEAIKLNNEFVRKDN